MKIIGFSIKKIVIEKKAELREDIKLKAGLGIEKIEEETIAITDKKGLRFDFSYEVKYEPGIADVEIKGYLITIPEKDEREEILKSWKKRKFDHSSKVALFNFILNKCNLKALELEDEIGLPLHIPFPKLKPKEEETKSSASYTG